MSYLEQATARMEAARIQRDCGKSKKLRAAGYDQFLFWQGVIADIKRGY